MNYTDQPNTDTEKTVKIIVKGQPWELPAHLSQAQITTRLNTNDWHYAMPDAPLTVDADSIAHYLNAAYPVIDTHLGHEIWCEYRASDDGYFLLLGATNNRAKDTENDNTNIEIIEAENYNTAIEIIEVELQGRNCETIRADGNSDNRFDQLKRPLKARYDSDQMLLEAIEALHAQ